MNSMEDFDKRVERFLKKQLTHEEELAFIEALKADKALLERAKTLALATDEMGKLRSERDAAVIKDIASFDEKAYQTAIWSNDQMSHFDDLTKDGIFSIASWVTTFFVGVNDRFWIASIS